MGIQYIVEDGSGMANANTYASLDEIKQYWDNSGYDYSSYTDDQLRVASIKSTRVIESQYRRRFSGCRYTETQALEWPRENAYYKADDITIANDEIPVELKNAIAEMMYSSLNGTADIQPVVDSQGSIKEQMVQVDVIIESTKYESPVTYRRDYISAVTDALSRLIGTGNPYDIKIIRVGG